MDTTRARTDSYLSTMQGFLDVVVANRRELSNGGEEETAAEETPVQTSAAAPEQEAEIDEDLTDLDVPEHFFNKES